MSKIKHTAGFKFPMTKGERIFGILFIPIHAVILSILVPMICTKIFPDMTEEYLNLCYYSTSFLIVLVCMFKFLKSSFSDIFDKPTGCLKALVFGYIFYYAMIYAVSVIVVLINGDGINPNSQSVIDNIRLNKNVMIVVAVLLAPMTEETMFRGALFGTLRQKSRILAYIVSILLFAIYHLWQYFLVDGFSLSLVIYLIQYIPAGIALAWSYEKSGSIWTSILLHALINFLSISVSVNLNL